MTHEEKEEKKHLIQLDWSSHSDTWKIEYANGKIRNDKYRDALLEVAQKDEAGFRQFLEDNYDIEQKYIDENWEE